MIFCNIVSNAFDPNNLNHSHALLCLRNQFNSFPRQVSAGFLGLFVSLTQSKKWFHRYQHIYAWYFYMTMTFYRMTAKDYLAVVRYRQYDLLKQEQVSFKQALLRITLYKLFYYAYNILLPLKKEARKSVISLNLSTLSSLSHPPKNIRDLQRTSAHQASHYYKAIV